MDERTNKPVPQLIEVEPMQDGYRWVAITAMLLAIGIILHTVSPNVGGVTPNWTIAMYSIVINLTRPKLSQAIGIGFIAGLTLVPSSKSAFPLGNEITETIIASKNGEKDKVLHEMADLWYHCLVLLAYHNITPEELLRELGGKRA